MAKVLTSVRTPLEKRYSIVFLGRVPHRQSPKLSWIIASRLQAVRLVLRLQNRRSHFRRYFGVPSFPLGQPTQNPLLDYWRSQGFELHFEFLF